MSLTLSQDQTDAIDGVMATLFGPQNVTEHAVAVLTGSAGTGKTTTVYEIVNKLSKMLPRPNVQLCATTHRAAAVLKSVVGAEVTTAHSAFKLKPSVTKYGKEVLKLAGRCDIPMGSVVVIDESSMIGNAFLLAIVETVKALKLKILFVGDNYQLPPPKDICSIFDGSLPVFTLTHVHRQAVNNPILDKAIEYREFIEGRRSTEPELKTTLNSIGEGITMLPHSEFVSSFVKRYMSYDTGADVEVPLCTYTNESAINYNTMIRKAAYFLEDSIEPYYSGERLVANSIVKQGDTVLLTNNEAVTVLDYNKGEMLGIPGYHIKVSGVPTKYNPSGQKQVFSPVTTAAADKVLNELKKQAIASHSKSGWLEFYELKNSLADLRPPFAGTTHKAQGGTFSSVYIDKVNINKCRDPMTRARLFYVALTRASKNVYINI